MKREPLDSSAVSSPSTQDNETINRAMPTNTFSPKANSPRVDSVQGSYRDHSNSPASSTHPSKVGFQVLQGDTSRGNETALRLDTASPQTRPFNPTTFDPASSLSYASSHYTNSRNVYDDEQSPPHSSSYQPAQRSSDQTSESYQQSQQWYHSGGPPNYM